MSRTGVWGVEERTIPFWNLAYIKCPHCGRYYPVDKAILYTRNAKNTKLKCPYCKGDFYLNDVKGVVV
ncbi:MAG: hypothetical protein RXO76_02910 [Vulcanisaeta sp.]|jgi:uncharacterized protein YbaR (Trm112 family)